MKVLTINKFKIAPMMLKNVEMCQQFGSKNWNLLNIYFVNILLRLLIIIKKKYVLFGLLKKVTYSHLFCKYFMLELQFYYKIFLYCTKQVLNSANSWRKFYLFIIFENLFSHGLLDFYDLLKKMDQGKEANFYLISTEVTFLGRT